MITDKLEAYIRQHALDDPYKLLLKASANREIDVRFAVEQIMARRKIKEKLPTWFATPRLVYPSMLAAEQCSSEQTARYKQSLLRGETVCDLTGGLGVDAFYFSQVAARVYYIERHADYCRAARNNFSLLGRDNIEVIEGDCRHTDLLPQQVDTFYIDPARRGDSNKRLFALADCEPNILEMKTSLLRRADRVVVKLSPMVDITHSLRLLPECVEVHVNSLRNECKEILFVLERRADSQLTTHPRILCNNFTSHNENRCFTFVQEEEASATVEYATKLSEYLYEPNASILKAGGFKSVAKRFSMQKLHRDSHLYTSKERVGSFPGRLFRVETVEDYKSNSFKLLQSEFKQINLSVRNFPIKPDEIKKRFKLIDGGDNYLFCTTLNNNSRVLIRCTKASF